MKNLPNRAVAALATLALVVVALVGPAAAVGGTLLDPCVPNPDACAILTVTVTGNGDGSITSGDGFIDCRRANGSTTGTCTHSYDLSGPDPVGYSVQLNPLPGSGVCTGSMTVCSPVGGAQGGLFQPGDRISQSAEFRLLAAPTATPGPTKTPKPTAKPTAKPTPTAVMTAVPATAAPTEAPASEAAPSDATPMPSSSEPTVGVSPLGTTPPLAPAVATDSGPSAAVLVFGALLIGVVAFAGGYATARRRTSGSGAL